MLKVWDGFSVVWGLGDSVSAFSSIECSELNLGPSIKGATTFSAEAGYVGKFSCFCSVSICKTLLDTLFSIGVSSCSTTWGRIYSLIGATSCVAGFSSVLDVSSLTSSSYSFSVFSSFFCRSVGTSLSPPNAASQLSTNAAVSSSTFNTSGSFSAACFSFSTSSFGASALKSCCS